MNTNQKGNDNMFNSNAGTLPVSIPIGLNNGGGFGNGNGFDDIIALAIIAMIFGWNGNGGIFGGAGSQGAATNYVLSSDFATIQRQLSDGFGSTESKLDSVNNGICSLGYDQLGQMNGINMNLAQGFNATQGAIKDCCCQTQQNIKDTQYAIATTGAGIQGAIKDCCCENEKIALQNRYESAQQNCDTLRAISDSTKQIIDYMANEKAQNLRDENFSLKLAASQSCQNQYLINQLRPAPVPSYVVANPYCNCAANPYGYGYFGGTTIA